MKKLFFPTFLIFTMSFFPLFGFSKTPLTKGGVGSISKANLYLSALSSKDYDTANSLLKDEGALLYTPNEKGQTPISLAIQTQDSDMLDYLLLKKVPLESRYYSVPPLVLALYKNSLPLFERLLDAGANPNVSYRRLSLLQTTILLKKEEFLQLLIRYKANVTQTNDPSALSPLAMALSQKSWDIVKLLVPYYSNLNPQNTKAQTPLDTLIIENPGDIESFLSLVGDRKNEVLNFRSKKSDPPLFFAIESGNIRTVQTLLDAGANVNITTLSSKETPLMRAVKMEDSDLVNLLMSYGPSLKAKDRYKRTVFWYTRKNKEILNLLTKN